MPTDISKLTSETNEQRFLKFRKTIKDGQGWTAEELVETLGISDTSLRVFMKKYGIRKQGPTGLRWFLVNEKTRKAHAD
ncbi:MAG: hypothetical protein EBR82_19175 [Caulobacteraceae bacterium]|nr:hypothetical protein [Caulobacteraceae bacterium]